MYFVFILLHNCARFYVVFASLFCGRFDTTAQNIAKARYRGSCKRAQRKDSETSRPHPDEVQ